MKVKLIDIYSSVAALNKLMEQPLPAKVSFRLMKLLNAVNEEVKMIEEQRMKLVKKHAEDGVTVAQDESGKKLVLIDNDEALVAANKELGITAPGWYLVQKTGARTRVELLIALADAPRAAESEEEDDTESEVGVSNPD